MRDFVIAMHKASYSVYGESTNHARKIKSLLNLLILMEFIKFNPIGIHLVLVHSFAYQKCSAEIDGDTYHAGIFFSFGRSVPVLLVALEFTIMPTLITKFNNVIFSICLNVSKNRFNSNVEMEIFIRSSVCVCVCLRAAASNSVGSINTNATH